MKRMRAQDQEVKLRKDADEGNEGRVLEAYSSKATEDGRPRQWSGWSGGWGVADSE